MALVLRFSNNGDALVPLASEFNEIDVISPKLKLGASKVNVNGEINEVANLVPHTYNTSVADTVSIIDQAYGNRVWTGDVIETSSIADTIASTASAIKYAPQAVNRTPQYGNTTYPTLAPSGWTSVVSSSQDDSTYTFNTPFTFYFNGTAYTAVYPASNGYFTFGGGSTAWSGISVSSPALNKIIQPGGDYSWQLYSTYVDPANEYVRWRIEGTYSTGGTLGSPGYTYEAAIFNPLYTGGVTLIYITWGISFSTFNTYICSSSTNIAPVISTATNTSYVFQGNSTGTTWTTYSSYSVTNTGW